MTCLIKFNLVLSNGGKVTYKTYTKNKRRLVNKARDKQWETATLVVSYYKDGLLLGDNEANCSSWPQFIKTLDAFTEKEAYFDY